MISSIVILLLIFSAIGYWVYKLVTYDWSKFEEDSEGDDFLKPYE
jgi:hypothetical protein